MFDSSRKSERLAVGVHPAVKLAGINERGFIQRTMMRQRYGLDIDRLTLWEYLLLLEHTDKQDQQSNQ